MEEPKGLFSHSRWMTALWGSRPAWARAYEVWIPIEVTRMMLQVVALQARWRINREGYLRNIWGGRMPVGRVGVL